MKTWIYKKNKHPAEYQGPMPYPLKSFADIKKFLETIPLINVFIECLICGTICILFLARVKFRITNSDFTIPVQETTPYIYI